jgi:hypothetical protein
MSKAKQLLLEFELACMMSNSARLVKLKQQLLSLLSHALPTCVDCGCDIPKGQGLGYSASESEWTDRSNSRPLKLEPLCMKCICRRIHGFLFVV